MGLNREIVDTGLNVYRFCLMILGDRLQLVFLLKKSKSIILYRNQRWKQMWWCQFLHNCLVFFIWLLGRWYVYWFRRNRFYQERLHRILWRINGLRDEESKKSRQILLSLTMFLLYTGNSSLTLKLLISSWYHIIF